jgi:Flp pilus assembly pilin Flp
MAPTILNEAMKVSSAIARFLREEERGQDVAEYCLITAFIALVCLGILWHYCGGLQGIWTSINASLASGNSGSSSAGGS